MGFSDVGSSKTFSVDDDEKAVATGEDGAVGMLNLGLVKELSSFAANMAANENQGLMERDGAKVVNLHVPGHGEGMERAVEFAHGFVEQSGDDAAMDVSRWPFVQTGELDIAGDDGGIWMSGVGGEDEVEALRIGWTAAEAVVYLVVGSEIGRREAGDGIVVHGWG